MQLIAGSKSKRGALDCNHGGLREQEPAQPVSEGVQGAAGDGHPSSSLKERISKYATNAAVVTPTEVQYSTVNNTAQSPVISNRAVDMKRSIMRCFRTANKTVTKTYIVTCALAE